MRLAIRGFGDGATIFEEEVVAELEDLELLAQRHTLALLRFDTHMIEFEFLDEADPNERFFRFGTDPSAMVMPIPVRINGKDLQ